MKYAAATLLIVLGLAAAYGDSAARTPASTAAKAVTFEGDIRPMLEQKCTPCHFRGGKMYDRLPFDRPETIVKLGTKLFTRIKDQPQRDLILRFIAAATKPAA
jgi:hypothetical protein